jgi:hypothetical protein
MGHLEVIGLLRIKSTEETKLFSKQFQDPMVGVCCFFVVVTSLLCL